MKRSLNLIVAAAALGLAGFAYAGSPPEDTGAAQPSSTEQPAATTAPSTDTPATTDTPSTDSSATSDASASTSADPPSVPSASAQASTTPAPSGADNMRLAGVVPSGMSMQEACTGFKSPDECSTALHVAQNLNIPFADLKSRVTGGEKLTAAIKELKPDADAKAAVRKAEHEVRADAHAPSG